MNNHGKPQSRAVRFLLSPVLYHGYRIFIAGMFLYAGVPKLADTAGFAAMIAAYQILPDPLVPCAALGLPVVEVLAGGGTLFNRRWAILGLLGMLILFLGVLSYGVAMGLDIDCGCFESTKNTASETVESVPMLALPGVDDGGLGSTIVQIEPVPGTDSGDETCTEESAGPSRLRNALVRDIFLFLGVLYLVAWPDLRRRYGFDRSSESELRAKS